MAEHIKAYSKDSNPNATFYVDDTLVVDLFPYKIQERDRFYNRNHPVGLNPNTIHYEKYWMEQIKNYIEGRWIEDKNGVWVYMMPKLDYYINYVKIVDEDRNTINPDLCDLEWIFFTYFMCLDGFSGFEGDKKYTCNRLVERYYKSLDKRLSPDERAKYELNELEFSRIPKSCFIEGTDEFKEFVNPWVYLTRTYLIDDPRGPLGHPLHENQRRNGMILGARGIRKSFSVYMGDFMHEWTFSGIRKFDEIGNVNKRLLFAMGSGSTDQMNRTLKNVTDFYDAQPGKYRFQDSDIVDWMGPLYKNYQGKLSTGKEFQHIIKGKNNIIELLGSTCQVSAITPDRTKIVAGDRFRRVYIEEVGFLEYIEEVFAANIDSLKLGKKYVGSWIATGTGGDMEAIRGSKNIFEHPEAFDVFSIPYYWKNPDKNIGLFIPAQYQNRDLDDGNGFIHLDLATKRIIKDRDDWFMNLDSVNAGLRVMYNPIIPDEMLIPNDMSILPKKEAQYRLSDIESRDLDKHITNVGELRYDPSYPHGVKFEKDTSNKLHPILEYNVDFAKMDRNGAFLMHEPPPSGKIPKYMYWVIYDPAAQSGEGTSLHSVIVYKHFLCKDGGWRDAIVAEWLGRKQTLDENYNMVIKIARFYNAKIFPEINIAGFIEWCKGKNLLNMLQRDSYELQMEISPGSKRSYYKAGFQMNARMKWWALQRLTTWLLEERDWDPESGIPILRNIDLLYSKRLLNEIIFFNEKDNFDHISSMLGLMILIGQLEGFKPFDDEEPDDKDFDAIPFIQQPKKLIRRRSKLDNFLV